METVCSRCMKFFDADNGYLCASCRQENKDKELIRLKAFRANKKPRPNGKDWAKNKKAALLRDKYTCQKCGRHRHQITKEGDSLHCHHINPVSNTGEPDNSIDNLIALCSRCHQKLHKKTKNP